MKQRKGSCRALLCLFALVIALCTACSGTQGRMRAGTYTGTGAGHQGEVRVEVEIGGDGRITGVTVVSHSEDAEYGDKAVETLPEQIVAAQSLGVDAVAGATITSRAILAAVADAVTQAGGDPASLGFVPVADIAAADTITIVGLPGGEVTITGAQLKANYEPITVEAVSISSSGAQKTITATGVTLEAILQSFGSSQLSYSAVLTQATDGYSIEIPDGILKTRDIIIAYEVDGEPQSPRTVIPDERAMYWSKFLSRIELLGASDIETADTTDILLLETAVAGMQDVSEDYKYYDEMGRAVPVSVLLERYVTEVSAFVRFQSTDQLSKNERYDTFAANFILYEGPADAIPMFTGPDLPAGMRLKQALSMKIGAETILSATLAQQVQGTDGLAVSDLLALAGMRQASAYEFLGDDGYTATIDAADIPKGTVTWDDDGLPAVHFEGLPGNTGVKRLLRIKAVT